MYQVFSPLNPLFWIYFIYFLFASLITFYIPGLLLLNLLRFKNKFRFLVAPSVGVVMWALFGFIIGWAHIRFTSYIYILFFMIIAVVKRRQIVPHKQTLLLSPISYLILIIGSGFQLLPMFGSGWQSDQGIRFYFVNIFDGVFHLSLIRTLVESFPPIQPGAISLSVTNYHYLSDLVLADMARVWRLPIDHLYFHFFPLVLSVFIGLLLVILVQTWTHSKKAVPLTLFFYYLAGELTWVFHFILGKTAEHPYEIYIDHGMIQFLNYPQAFAKAIFFTFLILWAWFLKRSSYKKAVLLGVLAGSIVGFKVYFGIATAAFIGLYSVFLYLENLIKSIRTRSVFFTKELLQVTLLAITAALIALSIYVPVNAQAGGLFYSFIAWPKLFLNHTKLNWNEWWLRLQVYEAAQNTKALIVMYAAAIGVFLFSIYHLRLLSFVMLFKRKMAGLSVKEKVALLFIIFACMFIGMNFYQTSGGANIFNFFVVSISIANIFTAIIFAELLSEKIMRLILMPILLIVLVQTFATSQTFIRKYYEGSDSQLINKEHTELLTYLESLPQNSVVQTMPHHYLDKMTPYLYYFTGKYSYYGGRGILQSHNQSIMERDEALMRLYRTGLSTKTSTISARLAKDLGITHVITSCQETGEKAFIQAANNSATISAVLHYQKTFENQDWIVLSPGVNK